MEKKKSPVKVKEKMRAEERVSVQLKGTIVNEMNCKLCDYLTFSDYIK